MPEVFTAQFDVYAAWLAQRGLAEVTVRGKTGMLRRFLAFLAGLGIGEVAALRVADVSSYVGSLAPMAASSRAGQLYFLREYLRFAVGQHGADPGLGAMFPVIVTDRDAVLPSVYRPGEIAGALTEAGNGSESPLRDRAVMLLASLLGLRSGDIKGLRFDQIDWANRRLSVVARKSGRRLDLPLPQECALAIIDYWKNERPEIGDPQVFLRHRAPHQPPAAGNHFHQVVAGCFARAGRGIREAPRAARIAAFGGDRDARIRGPISGDRRRAGPRRREHDPPPLRVDVARLRPLALEVPDGR